MTHSSGMSFFKALKALDVKAWANGPGLSAYVIRSAESAAYACSRLETHPAQHSRQGGHIALSALKLSLLRAPGPLGRAITSGAFGAVCN